MSTKGNMDTKLDAGALNEIVVFANMNQREIASEAQEIITICRQMEDEESLKGGDGETFRAAFSDIAKGANKIAKSTEQISEILDKRLGQLIELNKDKFAGSAKEQTATAANKAGVMAKE